MFAAAHPVPTPEDRFALTIDGLCRALAARAAKDRAFAPLVLLLWGRLRGLATRFAAAAARVRAGAVRRPARPRDPLAGPVAASRPRRVPPRRLPRGFGWLVRLAPETAPFGGQLASLLAEPEVVALLQAAPRLARDLRPVCRMLAAVRPPPRPPRQPPPPAPSPQAPASAPPRNASPRPSRWRRHPMDGPHCARQNPI